MRIRNALIPLALAAATVGAQEAQAQSAAVPTAATAQAQASIEGVMQELYAAVTREPGKPFAWERLRRITLPYTVMLPQARQSGGQLKPLSVDQFISNIDEGWKPVIGTARDRGFFERQTNLVMHEYGDVAIAFTTYEKGPWEPRAIQGRGINAVQLVRREGLWYILSIGWDEENSAGPLPSIYRGR